MCYCWLDNNVKGVTASLKNIQGTCTSSARIWTSDAYQPASEYKDNLTAELSVRYL